MRFAKLFAADVASLNEQLLRLLVFRVLKQQDSEIVSTPSELLAVFATGFALNVVRLPHHSDRISQAAGLAVYIPQVCQRLD